MSPSESAPSAESNHPDITEIQQMVSRGQFGVHGQPIYSSESEVEFIELLGVFSEYSPTAVFEMLEEARNTELFIDYTRQTIRRGLASIANLRESAGLDIGVSLNVPHALMAHTARWLPVLKAALEEYGFQKNGKEGKGRVIVEMTERDIPNLRLLQVREGIRELLEDESGILLAFDDVDDTNALTGLLKMAGEYITPHIIKVNGDIVKAVKEGNMEPARDTIRTAIKEGIGTIIFEDIEDQYVFTRLIQLVSSNPEIRMLFQGNYLGKKQPIEDITA